MQEDGDEELIIERVEPAGILTRLADRDLWPRDDARLLGLGNGRKQQAVFSLCRIETTKNTTSRSCVSFWAAARNAKPTGELVMWEKNRFGSTLCRHGNRKWYCGVDSCGGGPKYCKHAVAHALCAHASCREERPVGRCARAVASRATFSGGVVRGRGAKKHSPRTAPELRSGLRARQDFACPHNSNRSYCTVSGCGGTGLCQHGIHRSKCKDVRCMSRKKWLQHQMEIDEARDAAAVASSRECDQGAESEVTPCAVPAVTT